ncbi:MAG: hypothetical protein Q7W45_02960 [Bacteroidota bacterium]|nr:hypothetical protein [Bacteroidota bacterium]MDP3145785.1 hypothetical protein [Bacteroidota bacterium]
MEPELKKMLNKIIKNQEKIIKALNIEENKKILGSMDGKKFVIKKRGD